jgi:hypothetical protein
MKKIMGRYGGECSEGVEIYRVCRLCAKEATIKEVAKFGSVGWM